MEEDINKNPGKTDSEDTAWMIVLKIISDGEF
jgi:hypothetical protein